MTRTKKSWVPFLKLFSLFLSYAALFLVPGGFWSIMILLVVWNLLCFILLHPLGYWREGWGFFFQSLFLDLSVGGSLLFFSSILMVSFLVGVNLLASFLFWRVRFFLLYDAQRYQKFSYENLVNLVSMLLLYLITLNFGAFGVFLGLQLWIAAAIFGIMLFGVSVSYFLTHQISSEKSLFLGSLVTLLGLEFFWVAKLLPISFPVLAVLVATLLYFTLSIFRFYVLGSLNPTIWRRYSFLVATIFILILFTARWN